MPPLPCLHCGGGRFVDRGGVKSEFESKFNCSRNLTDFGTKCTWSDPRIRTHHLSVSDVVVPPVRKPVVGVVKPVPRYPFSAVPVCQYSAIKECLMVQTNNKANFLTKKKNNKVVVARESIDARKCSYDSSSCKGGFTIERLLASDRCFICDHPKCGKSFARNEELTRHRRIHSGERPHECPLCHKRFGRKDHLTKHRKTHQKASERRNYVCNEFGCNHRYTRSDALTRHKRHSHSMKSLVPDQGG